jgi:hypothetical protein
VGGERALSGSRHAVAKEKSGLQGGRKTATKMNTTKAIMPLFSPRVHV